MGMRKWYKEEFIMDKQKKKKQIFLLYYCGDCKTFPMKVACAATSATKIKMAIASLIKKGDMEYGDDTENIEKLKSYQQAKVFKEDWKTLTRDKINNKLRYGFYDYTYDGDIM
jgi:hypothetical protein